MRTLGTFTLHIQRSADHEPVRASVALTGAAADAEGVLHLTPDCLTLDQLEGAINGLQDELEILRADARRVFVATAGHA
jgi:hypothetical protein